MKVVKSILEKEKENGIRLEGRGWVGAQNGRRLLIVTGEFEG